jgi:hypothetical protein
VPQLVQRQRSKVRDLPQSGCIRSPARTGQRPRIARLAAW